VKGCESESVGEKDLVSSIQKKEVALKRKWSVRVLLDVRSEHMTIGM
jgi:hypothetical protein